MFVFKKSPPDCKTKIGRRDLASSISVPKNTLTDETARKTGMVLRIAKRTRFRLGPQDARPPHHTRGCKSPTHFNTHLHLPATTLLSRNCPPTIKPAQMPQAMKTRKARSRPFNEVQVAISTIRCNQNHQQKRQQQQHPKQQSGIQAFGTVTKSNKTEYQDAGAKSDSKRKFVPEIDEDKNGKQAEKSPPNTSTRDARRAWQLGEEEQEEDVDEINRDRAKRRKISVLNEGRALPPLVRGFTKSERNGVELVGDAAARRQIPVFATTLRITAIPKEENRSEATSKEKQANQGAPSSVPVSVSRKRCRDAFYSSPSPSPSILASQPQPWSVQEQNRLDEAALESRQKDADRKTRAGTKKAKITDTPTKGARAKLEALAFSSSSPLRGQHERILSSSWSSRELSRNGDVDGNTGADGSITPPSSSPFPALGNSSLPKPDVLHLDKTECPDAQPLPEELQSLVTLHSAFLTALSLHHAHHGATNPVDVRELYPGIQRTWKKRTVRADDIRRLLGMRSEKGEEDMLRLCNYGKGKICVELSDAAVERSDQKAIGGQVIDERALNGRFTRRLHNSWSDYQASHAKAKADEFLAQMPLASVKECSLHPKNNPLLSKGQRRLEDLKAGAIKAQERALAPTSPNPTLQPQASLKDPLIKSAGSRASALLDRLHAKALHQSTLKPAPAPEEIARRRALQRLPEIAPILGSLVVGGQKHNDNDTSVGNDSVDGEEGDQRNQAAAPSARQMSFTMPTLIQHLQMSLRNPIAVDEAIRSIRLLAQVVSEWVGIREMGRLCVVTVRGAGVGRNELERRIQTLLDSG